MVRFADPHDAQAIAMRVAVVVSLDFASATAAPLAIFDGFSVPSRTARATALRASTASLFLACQRTTASKLAASRCGWRRRARSASRCSGVRGFWRFAVPSATQVRQSCLRPSLASRCLANSVTGLVRLQLRHAFVGTSRSAAKVASAAARVMRSCSAAWRMHGMHLDNAPRPARGFSPHWAHSRTAMDGGEDGSTATAVSSSAVAIGRAL